MRDRNLKLWSAAAAFAVIAACNQGSTAPRTSFQAALGNFEVPTSGTTASGAARMTINGTALDYTVWVLGLANPTMAHIHVGPASASGPVRLWLCGGGGAPNCSAGASVTGTLATGTNGATTGGISFDSLISAIRSGNGYVNVRTTAFPGEDSWTG